MIRTLRTTADAPFDGVCLTGTWMRQLKAAVERLYREELSRRHTLVDAGVDT